MRQRIQKGLIETINQSVSIIEDFINSKISENKSIEVEELRRILPEISKTFNSLLSNNLEKHESK